MPRSILPALGHAASGSVGTAISTAATYPLDLVNTRLKVQRSLATLGGAKSKGTDARTYRGVLDALRTVAREEGGVAALYAGLRSDLAKSAADSFLFFLFYTWFRGWRLAAQNRPRGRRRRLGAAEELAVAAVAGACSRFFTMPVANVVARMQTAAMVDPDSAASADGEKRRSGAREVLGRIWRERGVSGLWAGYSAALVLTLNPSITFFLDNALRGELLAWGPNGPDADDATGAGTTFLLAAMSKAVATAITYPFQTAKARLQMPSIPPVELSPSSDEAQKSPNGAGESFIPLVDSGGPAAAAGGDDAKTAEGEGVAGNGQMEAAVRDAAGTAKEAVGGGGGFLRSLTQDNIFAMVAGIARQEGVRALYAGLGGELLKAFFSHGITMLSKDVAHRLVIRLYFLVAELWRVRQLAGGNRSDAWDAWNGGNGGRSGPRGDVVTLARGSRPPVRNTVTKVTEVVEIVVANMRDSSHRLIKDK